MISLCGEANLSVSMHPVGDQSRFVEEDNYDDDDDHVERTNGE